MSKMSENKSPASSSSSANSSSKWELPKKERVPQYPNPPEQVNPDPATLREQWRFAIRQYSKWYSHAWGTAIFAGLSFFALGWIIKGSNPLPSLSTKNQDEQKHVDGDRN